MVLSPVKPPMRVDCDTCTTHDLETTTAWGHSGWFSLLRTGL